MIFLIALLVAFLRFFRLSENLVFHGELGDNYLAIKNFLASGHIPLLGPSTSHPWLSFGPLFYWLFAPVLELFKYDPVSGAYFIAATQVILIFVNFYFVRKLFGKTVATVSSFLIAISPLFLDLARQSRFFSLVPLFFYPFVYFLTAGNLFFIGFFFGIILNFHLSPIVLILPAAIYVVKKPASLTSRGKQILKGVVGFIIPNIPFIIYNATHNFEMLKNLVLWLPYRVAGFVGVIPKNSPTGITVINNLYSLGGFMSASFMYRFFLGAIFVVIVFIYIGWQIKKNWKAKTINTEFLMVLFFLFGYAGLFIHGDPPTHYYLPLYLLPILFFSILLAKLKSKKIIGFILLVTAILNFRFYFSKNWFYAEQSEVIDGQSPYSQQVDISKQVIADADGRKFSIKRVGKGDEFDENYSQNYRYLLWLLGNEPVKNANITYTIYEKDGQSVNFSRSSDQK